MGNSSSTSREKGRKCRSLPNSPNIRRQIPVPYAKTGNGGGTAIPQPASVMVTRRSQPGKERPLPPTPSHQSGIPGSKHSSNASSGPNSPNRPQPVCKIPASLQNGSQALHIQTTQQQIQQKHSMLDKLKIFKKVENEKTQIQIPKRTSSSSGFSSARSERSDSSLSSSDVSGLSTSSSKTKIPAVPDTPTKSTKILSYKSKDDPKKKKTELEQPTKLQKISQNAKQQVSQPDSKLKLQVGRKVDVDSKTSSLLQQPKVLTSPTNSQTQIGIPKPVAAIKGTTKVVEEEKIVEDSVDINNLNNVSKSPMYPNHPNLRASDDPFLIMQQQNQKLDQFGNELNSKNGGKFNTVPSKLNPELWHPNSIIFEEDKQSRPLFRGFTGNNFTMPSPGSRGQHLVNDFCDENGQQIYCSESLRNMRYSSDIENGYLSDGNVTSNHILSLFKPHLSTMAEEKSRSLFGDSLKALGPAMDANGNTVQNRDFWKEPKSGPNSLNMQQTPSSPMAGRMDKESPRRNTSATESPSRPKGVPLNFGYIKRTNGSATANEIQTNTVLLSGGRTAQVSAVPRTNKIKVSGGTQTATADFQPKMSPQTNRSFSMTGAGAAQLSQSVKERFGSGTHSLPKPGLDVHVFQHRLANRPSNKINDGSLSDTTYAEVKPEMSQYAMWLNSNRLSEGDSLDAVTIGPNGLRNKMLQSPHSQRSLNRSNSIRSTKSEKTYPLTLSRGPDIETEPYYCLPVGAMGVQGAVPWSQPTSPNPGTRVYAGVLSPTQNPHRLPYPKKNDEAHGSQASLMSGGSSLYGTLTEEQRQANEVRRLKRELSNARDQVNSLSSQLSTNAHVVNAFENSLANMTGRLQQLTATTEKKDSELMEMHQTIELLKKQSIQAGLTSAHIHSMSVSSTKTPPQSPSKSQTQTNGQQKALNGGAQTMQRHLSIDSMSSGNSSECSSMDQRKKKGWLRSSFSKAFSRNAKITKTNRNLSQPSSLDSTLSPSRLPHGNGLDSKPPPSPSRLIPVVENAKPIDEIPVASPVVSDLKKQLREKDLVLTDIRLEALTSASQLENMKDTVMRMQQEMMSLKQNNERLQRMVTTRSLAGSEVSLGGPMSPGGPLGDARRYSLATDNAHGRPQSLQQLQHSQSLIEAEEDNIPPAPLSPAIIAQMSPTADILTTPAEDVADPDGKKIGIAVFLGQCEAYHKYAEELGDCDSYFTTENDEGDLHSKENLNETIISYTYISGKTTWQNLDYIVRKTFKDYLSWVDPTTNLGLNTDSITSYHVGDAKRAPDLELPELLPCGYIVGNVRNLYICLQGVGNLAFDSIIPRGIVHRYIDLLTEHRRLILCGPSGTGKSYLARKLAEFYVGASQQSLDSIATFNVNHKSSKELQQYLENIANQVNKTGDEMPSVIILDNLHHASALGDIFSCLLSAGSAAQLPCIIGTMSQATCNATNLQLHHNFRWLLTANHMEPVKGFLGRFLRRKLFQLELQTHTPQVQLEKVFKWLPTVWQHINSFLETHSSSDVTIGPQIFLACPLDMNDSQNWFADVWNFHLAPYLIETIKEGCQLYGRRGGNWTDPCSYIRETYPWPVGPTTVPQLRQITAEDVGLEADAAGNTETQDPLLNMLIRLQEAANYTEGKEQDLDCISICSNLSLAETVN